jgi:hypothetical protein
VFSLYGGQAHHMEWLREAKSKDDPAAVHLFDHPRSSGIASSSGSSLVMHPFWTAE